VLPLTSVIVTTVLLNVDWMCAMPVETFFFVFFLAAPALGPPAGAAAGGGGTLVFAWDMALY
jgi:hypothetical protein